MAGRDAGGDNARSFAEQNSQAKKRHGWPAGMPAVMMPGVLRSKTPKKKIRMDADFHPRKG
jgi:hypothetical protein